MLAPDADELPDLTVYRGLFESAFGRGTIFRSILRVFGGLAIRRKETHNVRVGLSQNVRMEQRLVQSPQMIQAMQILQLSAMDLQERVEQELLENPFLEEAEGTQGEDGPEENAEPAERRDEEPTALDGIIEIFERYERDFGEGTRQRTGGEDVDRKLEAMQNTPATYHSIGDSILEQIALIELDDRQHDIAEFLVYSLDPRGYLIEPLADLLPSCEVRGVTVEELQEVLEKLRHATHPGLGARDLRECLLLQLGPYDVQNPLVRTLIESHLEDITTNRIPRIARTTGHSIEEINQAIEEMRTLDPIPGREYGQSSAETIHPDVIVEEVDGKFEVRLTREGVPHLLVSPSHTRLLREAAKGDGVRKWIKQRLESARWFIDALEQRQSTLLRISIAIFERQQEFLNRGIKGLQPLRMIEIAEVSGVHISTVSRAVAGKYIQTPHGILALRSFFSGGTAKATGGMASQASIKQRIKELVDKEDAHTPLSDDRLADMLKEKDGISIARRTVTKYRKALAIPSSSQRRQF